MLLHLVRHPTPEIAPGICYGRLDIPARGVPACAAALRAVLPEHLPVFSSPLLRCRQLAEQLHPSPRLDARLAEMNFGDWEGRRWEDIGAPALDAWAAQVADFAPPGGESARNVLCRALGCVAGLSLPEAILVTHAGVMRLLLAHWQGQAIEHSLRLQIGYGQAISVYLEAGRAIKLVWHPYD